MQVWTGQHFAGRLSRVLERSGWLRFDRGDWLTRADVLSSAAAGCAIFSGIIHVYLAQEHYGHTAAAGNLFVLAGAWQIFAAFLGYPHHARRWNLLQVVFNAGLIGAYVISRVVPVLHPVPEPVDWLGVLTKISEVALIVCLAALLRAPDTGSADQAPG